MKQEMDKIQFEYRSEIHDIEKALAYYLEHCDEAKENETAQRLLKQLDVMDLAW